MPADRRTRVRQHPDDAAAIERQNRNATLQWIALGVVVVALIVLGAVLTAGRSGGGHGGGHGAPAEVQAGTPLDATLDR